jgi:phosphate starvation-inducible PhoH-like protein
VWGLQVEGLKVEGRRLEDFRRLPNIQHSTCQLSTPPDLPTFNFKATVGMSEVSKTIQLPSNESAIALAGDREENIKTLSRQTGATIVLRGQELVISGTEKQVERASSLVRSLKTFWKEGKSITGVDILTACHALDTQREDELQDLQQDVLARTRRGEIIRAKTFKQRQYTKAVLTHDLTFCIGPAGTGKTFLAVVLAAQALLANQYERLILTRPAVEAGEKLGFLPGDLQQKINPYLRPLYDACMN